MTKAEAIDLATVDNIGTFNVPVYQHQTVIGYGRPTSIYTELWYKLLLSGTISTMYSTSVWNLGGNYYEPWPYPDDEYVPPPPARPGYQYRSVVTVYDANDVVITSGIHVEFTNINRKGTWVYFKVTQPSHWPIPIVCWNMIQVVVANVGSAILQGTLCVQGEASGDVIYAHPAGYGGYNSARNLGFPENGHSVHGGAGDILYSGVTCIVDHQGGCVTVRDRNFRNPFYIAGVGTEVHNIRRNADGYRNFWLSYTTGGVNRCTPINITHDANFNPTTATLGTPLGITDLVDRLAARAGEILYYVVRGTNIIRKWDIVKDVALFDTIPDQGIGTITDILILPDGNLLVGYNSALNPTTYTIRRFDAISGARLRDYVFTSNGEYNRINYSEIITHFVVWTHEKIGESTVRKVNLDNGSILWTSTYREFEAGRLILDTEMYKADGTQGQAAQMIGFTNKFNFWVNPVYTSPSGITANGGGFMGVPPSPPPDDEYYPPVLTFPPILVYPPGGGSVDPTPPPEIPPYPGYPWFPPPPNTTPVPPAALPMALKIGGGLIVIDPTNKTRHDVYLDQQGNPFPVPIVVTFRTGFLGD